MRQTTTLFLFFLLTVSILLLLPPTTALALVLPQLDLPLLAKENGDAEIEHCFTKYSASEELELMAACIMTVSESLSGTATPSTTPKISSISASHHIKNYKSVVNMAIIISCSVGGFVLMGLLVWVWRGRFGRRARRWIFGERGNEGGRLPTYEEAQKGLPGYEKVERGR